MKKVERIERVMTQLLVRASYDGATVAGTYNDLDLQWAYARAKQVVDYCDGQATAELAAQQVAIAESSG